jgi:integrase/recombinase XerC
VPVDPPVVAAFLHRLRNPERSETRYAGGSLSQAVGAIRSCYNQLHELRLISDNPANVIHSSRTEREGKPKRVYDLDEARLIFKAIDDHPNKVEIRAFWEVLLFTGLRITEARWLTWWDVLGHPENIVVQAEHAKGGKYREVPREAGVEQALLKWRAYAQYTDDRDYVFASRIRGKPLAEDTIRRNWVLPFQRFIPDLGPHGMRHLFANEMLEHGAEVDQLQTVLGHADIATTVHYTRRHAKNTRAVRRAAEGLRRSLEGADETSTPKDPIPVTNVVVPKPSHAVARESAPVGPWPEPRPPRVLSGEEIRAILERCEVEPSAPRISAFVALGLFAGLSIDEAQYLTWGEAFRGECIAVRANITGLVDEGDEIGTVLSRGPERLVARPRVLTYYLRRLRSFLGDPADDSSVLQFGSVAEPADARTLAHWLDVLQVCEQPWQFEALRNTLADLLWSASVPSSALRAYDRWSVWPRGVSAQMPLVNTIDLWAEGILPKAVRVALQAQQGTAD